jgi:predicted anti-sigma-YlaC factor YlaD
MLYIQMEPFMQHLSSEQIDKLRQHQAPADELIGMDKHLESCVECRDRWRSVSRNVLPELQSPTTLRHLSYEEIRGYVDNDLSAEDLATIAAHTRECSRCRVEVEELSDLAAMLQGSETASSVQTNRLRWQMVVLRWGTITAALACLPFLVRYVIQPLGTVSMNVAGMEQVTDGGRTYVIGPGGRILNWRDLPEDYNLAIARTISTQQPAPDPLLDRTAVHQNFADSHLVTGVAYWQAGLREQAHEEFLALEEANPGSATARQLEERTAPSP